MWGLWTHLTSSSSSQVYTELAHSLYSNSAVSGTNNRRFVNPCRRGKGYYVTVRDSCQLCHYKHTTTTTSQEKPFIAPGLVSLTSSSSLGLPDASRLRVGPMRWQTYSSCHSSLTTGLKLFCIQLQAGREGGREGGIVSCPCHQY